MSRRFLIIAGAVCWTVAGADALYHLVNGDVVVPALMATAAVLWVALRQRAQILRRIAAAAKVEADTAA
jgi:hypothetical protein